MRFPEIVRFSDHFKVDSAILEKAGALDPILSFDSLFFIDPLRIFTSSASEVSVDGAVALTERLQTVFDLLTASERQGDPAWRGAMRLFGGREARGVSLGYGSTSTAGSSLPHATATDMLETACDFIRLGTSNPNLFLAMPLLIDGVGPDTISDITADAIAGSLAKYTVRVLDGITKIPRRDFQFGQNTYALPVHPFQVNVGPILLLPSDIVDDLPIASTWDEISSVSAQIGSIRESFDYLAGTVFRDHAKSSSERKRLARDAIRSDPDFAKALGDVLDDLKTASLANRQPDLVALATLSNDPRLAESQSDKPKKPSNKADVRAIVRRIVSDFKFLIEERRMSELLYREDGSVLREDVVQKLFFMAGYAHCKAWDVDITPEADTGNGPVDFKFSLGFSYRVVVELKLSTNPGAVKGYQLQVAKYALAEETDQAFFILVDVGRIGRKWQKIEQISRKMATKPIYIDGKRRPSASNLT